MIIEFVNLLLWVLLLGVVAVVGLAILFTHHLRIVCDEKEKPRGEYIAWDKWNNQYIYSKNFASFDEFVEECFRYIDGGNELLLIKDSDMKKWGEKKIKTDCKFWEMCDKNDCYMFTPAICERCEIYEKRENKK